MWCDVTRYDVMYVWVNVCMCITHVMRVMCVMCAMICYAMSGSFRFCHAVSWYVMLWSAMLPYGMWCHVCWATLCCVMLCHVMCVCVYECMLCHVMLWSVMLWRVIERMCMYAVCVMNVTLCNIISCYAMLCVCISTRVYVGVCHAMSSHAMLCYVRLCYVYMFVCVCKRVMWCYAMLWKAMVCMLCMSWMLCCTMTRYVISWYIVWSYVILCVWGMMELARIPHGRSLDVSCGIRITLTDIWICRAFWMVERGKPRAIRKWYGAKCVTVTFSTWSTVASFAYYASGMERNARLSRFPHGRSLGVSWDFRMALREIWNLVQNLKNNAGPKPRNSVKTTRRHKSSRRLILIDEHVSKSMAFLAFFSFAGKYFEPCGPLGSCHAQKAGQ